MAWTCMASFISVCQASPLCMSSMPPGTSSAKLGSSRDEAGDKAAGGGAEARRGSL